MVTNSAAQSPLNHGVSSPTSTTSNPEVSSNTTTSTTRRISDNRRSNKPIMEKRRRARINNCLNELKTLILDAMKKDPARHSKLEKADILEMTVKHLQNLQRQQVAISASSDPQIVNKFRAGFSECASEVGRYPGLDPIVKRRLLQHLANCLNQSSKEVPVSQVQVHILPNNNNSINNNNVLKKDVVGQTGGGGIIFSNGNGAMQLVPTRLPNGDIALVLPNATPTPQLQQQQPHQFNSPNATTVPLLVPIVPERTSSTASASASSASNYSPSHSPDLMDASPTYLHSNQPLSLVVRKAADPCEEEKPWRPW